MATYTLQFTGSEVDNKLQLVDTLNTNLSNLTNNFNNLSVTVTSINTALGTKADATSVYTKSEIDNKFTNIANLIPSNGTLVSSANQLVLSGQLPYFTTAPTVDNASGFLKFVVLSAEPATRYDGYLYIITSTSASASSITPAPTDGGGSND